MLSIFEYYIYIYKQIPYRHFKIGLFFSASRLQVTRFHPSGELTPSCPYSFLHLVGQNMGQL